MHQPTAKWTVSIIMLLVFCLLFAQSFGRLHSIAHAPTLSAVSAGTEALSTVNSLHDVSTSCVSLDEACLAASLHTPLFVPPLLPGVAVLSQWAAFLSWEQPLQHYFSSRAPPV
jgi:ABC-type transport system involved in cytochrome c biogenesis permease component